MNRTLLFSAITIAILSVMSATAAKPQGPDPWENYDEAVFMDMDFDNNLKTPALQKTDKRTIRNYMRDLADQVASRGYQVELDRDDEVMVIVIDLGDIFLPNDTLLAPRFDRWLKPVVSYLHDPGMFKIVYAIHSDNTGSENYNYMLSQERVNSLYDWMLDNISEDLIVIPFAMGDTDPVAPNNTMAGRRANRRLEIFFIPGPEMITRARAGTLGKP